MILKKTFPIFKGYSAIVVASLLQLYINTYVVSNFHHDFIKAYFIISQISAYVIYMDFGVLKLMYSKNRNNPNFKNEVGDLLSCGVALITLFFIITLVFILFSKNILNCLFLAAGTYSLLIAILKSKYDALGRYHSIFVLRVFFLIYSYLIFYFLKKYRMVDELELQAYSIFLILGYSLAIIFTLFNLRDTFTEMLVFLKKSTHDLFTVFKKLLPIVFFSIVSGLVVSVDKFIAGLSDSNQSQLFYMAVADTTQKAGIITSVIVLWLSQRSFNAKLFKNTVILSFLLLIFFYFFKKQLIKGMGFDEHSFTSENYVILLTFLSTIFCTFLASPLSIALTERYVYTEQLYYYLIELFIVFIGSIFSFYISSLVFLACVVLFRSLFNLSWTIVMYKKNFSF